MFLEGKIKVYHPERGFGFIEIEGEKRDLFFHIKDFPNTPPEPQIGERVKCIKIQDRDKFKADRITRLDFTSPVPQTSLDTQRFSKKPKNTSSNKTIWIVVAILLGLTILGYVQYTKYRENKQQKIAQFMSEQEQAIEQQRAALGELPEKILTDEDQKSLDTDAAATKKRDSLDSPTNHLTSVTTNNFSCDGRQHCSQMRSYEEAVYFNSHCPDTKMDGDGDGVPCESQFGKR